MEGADRLKLFKADLLAPGAFDEAVAGCDMVIHTASPYQLDVPKGEQQQFWAVHCTTHVHHASSISNISSRSVVQRSNWYLGM